MNSQFSQSSQSSKVPRDILSFDGGGSRGIMEVAILKEVMNCATILWTNPENLNFLLRSNDISKEEKVREKLITQLDNVKNPIHPGLVYDMIVGTSTGALIAFGLVGGNRGKDGKRSPMSLEECIKMYEENTKQIFNKSWFRKVLDWFISVPVLPYSKNNVNAVLHKQFNESTLSDFKDTTPIAGAVARQLGQHERLELFDTRKSEYKYFKTYQVLQASTNAPIYFDTPVKIGDKMFVDGGVGGNCPLAQGLNRAREIFGGEKVVKTALSIGPPVAEKLDFPNYFQFFFWLKYLVGLSTDGYAVYLDTKARNKMVTFRRLAPRGKALKNVGFDEVDTKRIMKAFYQERSKDNLFLVDVIAIATFVVETYFRKSSECKETTMECAARHAEKAGEIYIQNNEFDNALDAYDVSKRLWENSSNQMKNDFAWRVNGKIAACLRAQCNYNRASDLYEECIKYYQDNPNKDEKDKEHQLSLDLAECYLYMYRFEKAKDILDEALERSSSPQVRPNKRTASILNRLGWCHRKLGNYDKAVEYAEEARSLYEKVHQSLDEQEVNQIKNSDNDDYQMTSPLTTLALTYHEQGKYDEALRKAEEAYEMSKELVKEPDHPRIADSLDHLALCLISKKETDKAVKKLDEALEMKKRLYKEENNLSIAKTLAKKARALLYEQKQHLSISEKFGKGAKTFLSGKKNEPLELAQQALQKITGSLGVSENYAIAKVYWIIGLCLAEECKYEEAVESFKTSIKRMKEILHEKHPALVQPLIDLGCTLIKENKFQLAEHYLTEATKIEKSTNNRHFILELVAEKLKECNEVLSPK